MSEGHDFKAKIAGLYFGGNATEDFTGRQALSVPRFEENHDVCAAR